MDTPTSASTQDKNPKAIAVALVPIEKAPGQIMGLLGVRRAIDPGLGRWALPGGFVDQGESIEAAALRELQEETGVKRLAQPALWYSTATPDGQRVLVFARFTPMTFPMYRMVREAFRPNKEVSDLTILDAGLHDEAWAFPLHRAAVLTALNLKTV